MECQTGPGNPSPLLDAAILELFIELARHQPFRRIAQYEARSPTDDNGSVWGVRDLVAGFSSLDICMYWSRGRR